MYLQNCGLLMCKGQELSLQESLQERMALINSSKPIASKNTTIQHTSQRNSYQKEVFSFKLNGFRNYGDSDKARQNTHQTKCIGSRQQMGKLQYYRSSQKISLKTSCIELSKQFKVPNFQPPTFSYPTMKGHGIDFKKPSIIKQGPCQQSFQPKIIFKMVNNQIYDNKIGLNKSSQDPEISSKNRKQNKAESQIKLIDSSEIGQTSQSISTVQLQRQQKGELSNSIPSLIFNNSHTQQLDGTQNPTFKQIKNCQPRRPFENIKTLKTIHTTSQFKQNSAQNSTQNFGNLAFQDQHQYSQHQNRITTQKNFMKKKKKTAFFGFLQKEDTNQNQSNLLRQNLIHQGSIENESFEEENPKKSKKVQFLFQSQNSFNQTENESLVKIQQKPKIQSINYQYKCHPSLNSIVQSAALMSAQIKQTPLNSIKEMIFQRYPQQSSPKFKHVNTIKSIGGDSLYSQNSYLDLKFMQSIQSRRTLFKLT